MNVRIDTAKHTTLNTMHHVSASIKLFPKGKSRVRALKLSIIGVIGCIEANLPIPLGIVSTGANPELVKGKIKRGNNSPVAPFYFTFYEFGICSC